MRITFVFALLLILLVTIFAVQNNAMIEVNLLFWRVDGSLALVLVITIILGILIGLLLSTPTALRNRSQLSELRKRLRLVETDLEEARRAMPAPSPEKAAPAQSMEEIPAESPPPIQEQDNRGSSKKP